MKPVTVAVAFDTSIAVERPKPRITQAGYGPDDQTLLNLILEEDEVGLKAGEPPKARSLKTLLRVVGKISPGGGNIIADVGKPTLPTARWRLIMTDSGGGLVYPKNPASGPSVERVVSDKVNRRGN